MAERKETPESPEMGMEHKMHSMAGGQEMNEPGQAHKMHEMGMHPGKSHEVHRGRHEGHMTADFKRRFIVFYFLPSLSLPSPRLFKACLGLN